MEQQTLYEALREHFRPISLLQSTAGVLGWDEQTHLPPAGVAWRAEQAALLHRMVHEQFTSPETGELIARVESATSRPGDDDLAVTARELRRQFDRATKLPGSLVAELSRHETLAQAAWVDARKKSSWADFKPWLERTFELKRQVARCYGYRHHPYDALIEDYEPHETTAGAAAVLEGLRDELIRLVQKVAGSGKRAPELAGPFAVASQEAFGTLVARSMGFDFDAGRLDVSVHPFCSGLAPGDTRITTRYRENDLADALYGVLHEVGHGLYEQGLPKAEHPGLPLGDSVSLGIHESQSRLWENLVGRSRSFWRHFAPVARDHFPALRGVGDDTLLLAVNQIEPSLIRVEADEVTYNLHIMVRFELESDLVAQKLDPADLPGAWDAKMKQYLGITPPDAARGCLQDIHWSAGLVGYFPTYTLGNLYASQFFEQARKDLGDLDAMFARGEFRPLLDWLRTNIHHHGRRYSARELVRRVTGRDLSADALLTHLRAKVDEFYG